MLEVIVENQYGEKLNLTSNNNFDLVQITGLTPNKAIINSSNLGLQDGAVFNSSKLDIRNITMLIVPQNNLEKSRIELYKFFRSKQYIKIYLKTNYRNVWIDGYIENVEGDLYENPQRLQPSILCPDPYFKAEEIQLVEFAKVQSEFSFEWTPLEIGQPLSSYEQFNKVNVINPSEDETGIILEFVAIGTVLEPTVFNETMRQQFTIEYEMLAGDKMILNTCRGKKSLIVIRDGIETNIINRINKNSNWFTLRTGDNVFSHTCVFGAENLFLTLKMQPVYQGV